MRFFFLIAAFLVGCVTLHTIFATDICGGTMTVTDKGPLTCGEVEASVQDALVGLKPRLNMEVVHHNKLVVRDDLTFDVTWYDDPASPRDGGYSGQVSGLDDPYPSGNVLYVDRKLVSLCHEMAHSLDIAEGNLQSYKHAGWDSLPNGWYALCRDYEMRHWFYPPESSPGQERP